MHNINILYQNKNKKIIIIIFFTFYIINCFIKNQIYFKLKLLKDFLKIEKKMKLLDRIKLNLFIFNFKIL
jgi:hypothetical protein